jgi:VIT1/CCC1 family predicted Fe2+/Mn2+ transporter
MHPARQIPLSHLMLHSVNSHIKNGDSVGSRHCLALFKDLSDRALNRICNIIGIGKSNHHLDKEVAMVDSRFDWRKPGRDYLDPELENIIASSLMKVSRPRLYRLAAFQVGTASIIAGALLLLLSTYGSTMWTSSTMIEVAPKLLTLAVMGILLSLVGAVVALVSGLLNRFSPDR